MRLICMIQDPQDVKRFSSFLTSQGIENQTDGEVNSDWGSENYGTLNYRVWVIDEDDAEKAYAHYQEFMKDPNNPLYSIHVTPLTPPKPPLNLKIPPVRSKTTSFKKKLGSPITFYLILACILIFVWSGLSTPELKSKNGNVTQLPIYTSPAKEALLYDFPKAYEILAKLVQLFGIDALHDPDTLPQEGKKLIQDFEKHPYWQGFYEKTLNHLKSLPITPEAPLFEKIRQGEIWRLFSPILLHGDIFHLLFNMIWLFALGRQLEIHLGGFRYILFILVAALITNTAQYMMSGPNFVGFSGVLCAMITFIWQRQLEAPWEGYQLQRSTFIFIMLFIFGMMVLQSLAFLTEVMTNTTIATAIANTAHLSGAALGYLLAKTPFFTRYRQG